MSEPLTDEAIAKWKAVADASRNHNHARIVVFVDEFSSLLNEVVELRVRLANAGCEYCEEPEHEPMPTIYCTVCKEVIPTGPGCTTYLLYRSKGPGHDFRCGKCHKKGLKP